MDRIDMRVFVSRLTEESYIKDSSEESSAQIKKRVKNAIEIQNKRFKGNRNINYNSEIGQNLINRWIREKKVKAETIINIGKRYSLSARGISGIIKVARTIADLDSSENIEDWHIVESASYRAERIYG